MQNSRSKPSATDVAMPDQNLLPQQGHHDPETFANIRVASEKKQTRNLPKLVSSANYTPNNSITYTAGRVTHGRMLPSRSIPCPAVARRGPSFRTQGRSPRWSLAVSSTID